MKVSSGSDIRNHVKTPVSTSSFKEFVAEFELTLSTIMADRFKSAVSSLILSCDELSSSFVILSYDLESIFPDLLLELSLTSRGRSRGFLTASSSSSTLSCLSLPIAQRNKVKM